MAVYYRAVLNLCSLILISILISSSEAQSPGFISIDCGGTSPHTDSLGLSWTPDSSFPFGTPTSIPLPSPGLPLQLSTLRHFPASPHKFCYGLPLAPRSRYLVRASFLYANFDQSNTFPKFDLSIGPSHWATVVIGDGNAVVVKEAVVLAVGDEGVSVCVYNAVAGQPFVNAIEVRRLNGSMYYTDFETGFFLGLSARINFGALSDAPVRYPDDPYDRIWQSDQLKRPNFLVDVAPGTTNISTQSPIDTSSAPEKPPSKVLQTAVEGQNRTLHYRLNLPGFPGPGWAFCYFAEISELGPAQIRKFRLVVPGLSEVSKPTVNVVENAQGGFRVYEPGFWNVSLPFVFGFEFRQVNESTLGPILNAMEIYKYLPISAGSNDVGVIGKFVSNYLPADWAQEGGDPCLPVPWTWVKCTADSQPLIKSIVLSGKNLSGNIPAELAKLPGLVEIWLDGNNLTGPIPDLSACTNLQIIHLENNKLTGGLPSYLSSLPNLKELYIQNNMLSGILPRALLSKNIIFNYSGNVYLEKEKNTKADLLIIICIMIGVACLLAVIPWCYFLFRKRLKFFSQEDETTKMPMQQKPCATLSSYDEFSDVTAHRYGYAELERATAGFERNIGSGGFGVVYYGKTKDGKEIAVKVLTNDSSQGRKQFSNEVSLLSRIHHRNLVSFLGYCPQDGKNMLVYEFMENGTLKEHLHGPKAKESPMSWLKRLEIAEDSARGIEYLHTGCTPTIIHRDIKTSNILLDKNMRAKVADFGLSKLIAADESHGSTIVRGTVGYLDPDYYTNQQLTEKSDVYSFGIILFELISGQQPLSGPRFGEKHKHISDWAKHHYETGNIEALIDPSIDGNYTDIQSVWKIAEVAVRCSSLQMTGRPAMSEVLKEIQDAIWIEQVGFSGTVGTVPVVSRSSPPQYPELR